MRAAANLAESERRDQGAAPATATVLRAGPEPGAARLLRLQRAAGNRATARAAERWGRAAAGRRPTPISLLRRARGAGRRMLARERLPYQHQWENPAILEMIYPGREMVLKKFVNMYREVELLDMTDPADRQKVIDHARAEMQKRLGQLQVSGVPSKQDTKLIKGIEAALKKGEKSVDAAWREAVQWEKDHHADAFAGKELMAEVKRLFGTSGVPDWLEPLILDYAGLRYNAPGKPSAHGSYYHPVRLLYFYEQERGTWAKAREQEAASAGAAYEEALGAWEKAGEDKATRRTRGRKPRKPKAIKQAAAERTALSMPAAEALEKLEQLHDAGEIPAWAWHKIVRLTELRTWYAGKDWEDESREKPPAAASQRDELWKRAIGGWTGKQKVGSLPYGSTGWRKETYNRNAIITTRMVCNELSEASQRQRGITLEGGISANAREFAEAARKGAEPGAPREIAGAFLKAVGSADDLLPGASLFWSHGKGTDGWSEKPLKKLGHAAVHHIRGGKYPMPAPPEYIGAWKTWDKENKGYQRERKAWERKQKRATTEEAKAALGEGPKPSSPEPQYNEPDLVPDDGQEVSGWKYTVKDGEPVSREKGSVKQYLLWRHQATVLRVMPGERVFTWETTDTDPGPEKLSVSGLRVRKLSDLTKPGVFVGYMPGKVGAPGPTAAAAAAEAAATSDGGSQPAPTAPAPKQQPTAVPLPLPLPFWIPLYPSPTLARTPTGQDPAGERSGRPSRERRARLATAHFLGPLETSAPGASAAAPGRPLGAGLRTLQRYSGGAAASYARKWAHGTNPIWGTRFGNDCTAFVSQALIAGGWSMVGGSCDDRKDDDVWWYGPRDCWFVGGRPWPSEVRASFTWAGAQNLNNYFKVTGSGTKAGQVWDLEVGDVLQMDFGAGGYLAGRIGHTMIVTKKTADNLYLSYHTSDHLDEPFWGTGGILDRYPNAGYYGWKVRNQRAPKKTAAQRRQETRDAINESIGDAAWGGA